MMRFVRLTSALTGVFVLVCTLLLTLTRRDANPPQWIIFVGESGGVYDIYRMRSDGSDQRNLTHALPGWNTYPQWSPDGGWIAFTATEQDSNVYRMRFDGSTMQQLTSHVSAGDPKWSPDGRWIVFESWVTNTNMIYRIRADGSHEQRLTFDLPVDILGPQWSPDGQWLVFVAEHNGTDTVFRMRADGSDQQPLTPPTLSAFMPCWSPDGQWIAFEADNGAKSDIYRMHPDGTELQRLTSEGWSWGRSPQWSPDGQWIAFISSDITDPSIPAMPTIFRMRSDGSGQATIIPGINGPEALQWSPDGQWIAFISYTGYTTQIFRVRADGSELQQLTRRFSDTWAPQWSPPYKASWQGWRSAVIGFALVIVGIRPWRTIPRIALPRLRELLDA